MRCVALVLLVAVGISQAAFLLPYTLPSDVIQTIATKETRKSNTCQNIQLNYCQNQFNTFLGIDDAITWRDGSSFFEAVESYLDMNVTELMKVCNVRTQFYQCLGSSYYSCINLEYLAGQSNSDLGNAFDYVKTFRGLEWMCSGGYREVINHWSCLKDFPSSDSYKACTQTFNSAVSTSNYCPAVEQAGACLSNAYHATCGANAGHYGCKNFNSAFDTSCSGLKCLLDKD
ncbi:DUF19 domain-containing protein [Caenorhabditis elegans]|uniref:DUF19 domain-containing protein n=1 Tax=Caenorhabditis elegans TaxID=6239 RepID=Q9N3H0_CAEEL|nr:DUF19 domain-containing protein [Caenorhabditis elegans]CCD73804.1 DUF19 domain-containing protein [Caenorhabditis elegans]|eukprot:NP_497678.1 Uncharacterized protein CELE_Y53G8AM.5 [Caenorhabditis elegans]